MDGSRIVDADGTTTSTSATTTEVAILHEEIRSSRGLSIDDRGRALTHLFGFNQDVLTRRASEKTLRVYCRDFYAYLEYAVSLTRTDTAYSNLDPVLLVQQPSTLARWMTYLSAETTTSPVTGRPYSPNTINRMGTAVRRIMKEAGAQHYLNPDAVKGFHDIEGVSKKAHKGRLRKDIRFVPSPIQMREITNRAEDEAIRLLGLRNIAILHMLTSTGLRVDTFRLLSKEQIVYRSDLGHHCARIISKNETEPRDVQMSREAYVSLQAWLAARPQDSNYLFTRFDGRGEDEHERLSDQPLSAFAVRKIAKRAAREAGIPQNVTTHTYRRYSGTTIAARDGVKDAQKHLGHKNASTTLDNYVIKEAKPGVADNLY